MLLFVTYPKYQYNVFMKKKYGFTLIEVLFVIGLMALLLAVAITLVDASQSSSRTDELKTEVLQIRDESFSLFGGNLTKYPHASGQDFSGVLAQSGLLPHKYISSSGGLVGPNGEHITIFLNNWGDSQIAINIDHMNKLTCVRMTTIYWGDPSSIFGFYLNGIAVFNISNYTIPDAEKSCIDSNYNYLLVNFYM